MIFDTEAQHLTLEQFNKNVKPFIEKIAFKYPGKIGYFTKDVDDAALAIARAKQRQMTGWERPTKK